MIAFGRGVTKSAGPVRNNVGKEQEIYDACREGCMLYVVGIWICQYCFHCSTTAALEEKWPILNFKLFTSTTRKLPRAVFSHHNCINRMNTHFGHTKLFYSNSGMRTTGSLLKTIATRLCLHMILCRLSKEVRLHSSSSSVATTFLIISHACSYKLT